MPEHNRPDLFTAEASGHMIPMRDYGGGLGWTSLALRRATAGRLDEQVSAIIDRAGNTFSARLMERLFFMNETRVGANGISLPFADAGASDAEYVPVSFNGTNFDATHNHYFRLTDDEAGRTAFLAQGSTTIREHGHPSPYVLVIPEVDVDLWVAQPEFTSPERAALLTAGLERRALVPNTDLYIGVWETARSWGYVMPTSRLPANYAGMFKLYGHGNAKAPLVVRYERGFPFGLTIEGQVVIYPLQEAVSMFTFGAGVNDRTNGALCFFGAAGDYVNPVLNS
jgi:hypothetical protein